MRTKRPPASASALGTSGADQPRRLKRERTGRYSAPMPPARLRLYSRGAYSPHREPLLPRLRTPSTAMSSSPPAGMTPRDLIHQPPRTWLVTGVAGFIGSNLLDALLSQGEHVIGLDNFATGKRSNLADVQRAAGPEAWTRFRFIEGDIRDLETCQDACRGVNLVLHQAALGSVPRSLADPITTNHTNIDGHLNMLVAARDQRVSRFVYALTATAPSCRRSRTGSAIRSRRTP
jgi:hypothetical protein